MTVMKTLAGMGRIDGGAALYRRQVPPLSSSYESAGADGKYVACHGNALSCRRRPRGPEGKPRTEGSVVKKAAVGPSMLVHEGPARVFDSEEEAQEAIMGKKDQPGDVVVIRYEGPEGRARDA